MYWVLHLGHNNPMQWVQAGGKSGWKDAQQKRTWGLLLDLQLAECEPAVCPGAQQHPGFY